MEGPKVTFKQASAAAYSSSDEETSDDDFILPNEEFNEYRPRKRRRTGRDPKESAALGVFGSDSEDDGKRWKAKSLRGKGLSFVGAEDNGKVAGEYSDDEDERTMDVDGKESSDTDEQEEEDEAESGFRGFRMGASSGILTFQKAASADEAKEPTPSRQSFGMPAFDGATPFGRGFVPSSANEPVLRDDLEDTPPKKAMPSAFGPNAKKNPNSFGARMMAKMGYQEGKGLGKEGQGRNVIIEANLRPQGAGLGAVKEKTDQERREEKRQAKMRGETVSDSEEEERKKKARKQKLKSKVTGFDSAASTPKRQKPRFMTADEIKRTAPGLHIPDAFMPILDMTGPGSKVVPASGLSTPTTAAPESEETVATRKILRRAYRDLAAFSEEWKNLSDRGAWVEAQLSEYEKEMENLTLDYQQLMDFSEVITNELPAAGSEWESVIVCLHKAANVSPGSQSAETAAIIVAALEPFFKDPEWDLLKEPSRYAVGMKGLESLLMPDTPTRHSVDKFDSSMFNGDSVYRQHHRSTTPYESLMYRFWLPRALRALRDCDISDPAQLMAILENWEPLLPQFIHAEFLENVTRKLHTTLTEWNPKRRREKPEDVSPHIWLFPWLPFLPPHHLDPKGSGLVADVRRKFRQLIDAWDFSRGLIPGLTKWKEVLGKEWKGLMLHVLPSMGRYLALNFRVDPADQEPYLSALEGVLDWTDILGKKYIAEVVRAKVFPMWHAKLAEWFALGIEADLGEIAGWFEWWDSYFPPEVGVLVREEFERGLLTIERALDRAP